MVRAGLSYENCFSSSQQSSMLSQAGSMTDINHSRLKWSEFSKSLATIASFVYISSVCFYGKQSPGMSQILKDLLGAMPAIHDAGTVGQHDTVEELPPCSLLI